jgi:hypothetical protein
MRTLALRTAMHELTVRAMLRHAASGGQGDAVAAGALPPTSSTACPTYQRLPGP